MSLPLPRDLHRRALRLCQLQEHFFPGADHPRFTGATLAAAEGFVLAARTNGGDHAVLWVWPEPGRALLKAFDHESDASPHQRDDGQPDPALTEGMPTELAAHLDEAPFGLAGSDRTFCAWFNASGGWRLRGEEEPGELGFPADLLLAEPEDVGGWLGDSLGGAIHAERLEALLEGTESPTAAELDALRPPARPPLPPWLEGRGRIDPFHLTVRALPGPGPKASDLKALRDLTGLSIAAAKGALVDGGVVYEGEMHRHDHHLRCAAVAKILAALDAGGGASLHARPLGTGPGDGDFAIDRETYAQLVG